MKRGKKQRNKAQQDIKGQEGLTVKESEFITEMALYEDEFTGEEWGKRYDMHRRTVEDWAKKFEKQIEAVRKQQRARTTKKLQRLTDQAFDVVGKTMKFTDRKRINLQKLRLSAAVEIIPYVHPRKSSVEGDIKTDIPAIVIGIVGQDEPQKPEAGGDDKTNQSVSTPG